MAWLNLSALKSRSPLIRHKSALRVQALLRDASMRRVYIGHRIAGRQSAKRQIVSLASVPCCPTPCVPPLRALPCRTEPRSRRRGSTQRFLVQAPPPVDMPCGEQRDCASCRSASAYRPSRCGEGRVPRVPSPAVAACGGTVQRVPPRARPVYIHGRAQSARTPPGCKGTATRPRAPSRNPYVCRM